MLVFNKNITGIYIGSKAICDQGRARKHIRHWRGILPPRSGNPREVTQVFQEDDILGIAGKVSSISDTLVSAVFMDINELRDAKRGRR